MKPREAREKRHLTGRSWKGRAFTGQMWVPARPVVDVGDQAPAEGACVCEREGVLLVVHPHEDSINDQLLLRPPRSRPSCYTLAGAYRKKVRTPVVETRLRTLMS